MATSTRKNVARTVAYTVAILACIVSIVFFVFHDSIGESDPTLMGLCFNEAGIAYVAESSNDRLLCGGTPPERLRWPDSQLPINVSVIGGTRELTGAVAATVGEINRSLDFELVRMGPPDNDAAELIVTEQAISSQRTWAGGCTLRKGPNATITGTITVSGVPVMPSEVIRVVMHEFGHCAMGLDHDRDKGSAMFGSMASDLPPRYTDDDIKAVKKVYQR